MSKRARRLTKDPSSSQNPEELNQPSRDKCPVFSFQYLTTNTDFNFKGLTGTEGLELLDRLRELSGKSWLDLYTHSKKNGLEGIPRSEVPFPLPDLPFEYDAPGKPVHGESFRKRKYIVFRFGKHRQRGRILGVKKKKEPIFYILGVDTHFKLYDHGSWKKDGSWKMFSIHTASAFSSAAIYAVSESSGAVLVPVELKQEASEMPEGVMVVENEDGAGSLLLGVTIGML